MKLSKLYFSLFAVAALTACSADDDGSATKSPVVVGNSDVMVKLSAGQGTRTRASLESDDDGLFEAQGLGIFMLATQKQNTNPDELNISWEYGYNEEEPNLPYTNPWAVWIDNAEADAVKDGGNTRTDILWKDGVTRWYPIGNWYSYRFYGYYPHVDDSKMGVTTTQRIINYTGLDGTKDIIWGRSAGADMNDEHEKYAYSARYFRQAGYKDRNPEIAFVHKMMRLQFCIQGIADENAEPGHEFESANTMKIDTIIVEKVPTVAQLVVADLNETNDGKISYDWENDLADVGVLGENDGVFVKEQVNNDELIKVGQPVLLPVPDAEATAAGFTKYRVKIRLRNTDGVVFNHEKPLDLNAANYEAGISYRVAIRIAGPKQVTVSARLNKWVDDNDTENIEQDNVRYLTLD